VLLVGNGLDANAITQAHKHVTDTLEREATRLGDKLREKIADFEQLDYQTQSVDLATGEVEKEAGRVAVNAANIEDLFRRAKRVLGDSAAKWYWDTLCDAGADAQEAKVKVAALADDPSVAPALESAAKTLVDLWRTEHNGAISGLPDAKRAQFYSIWQQAKDPQQVVMIMPSQITAPGKGTVRPRSALKIARSARLRFLLCGGLNRCSICTESSPFKDSSAPGKRRRATLGSSCGQRPPRSSNGASATRSCGLNRLVSLAARSAAQGRP
jgi:hypothetical protein